ncbi:MULTISPECIES: VOC family protein [unclassified Nodularia (in: cyanobacteria)]|uniref:VOC family protein n=1 Tax=unclassified Nodularia (in: cyanobacteria) TaxID=2656917 RepID=UPI001881CD58|nr:MULTISPECIES: VOC family protein [unclassified Nodularia (in: cyanobacteria)]MBE9198866.1 VOC family protein [Nodularia sp. LEGE 06071]MCC2695514.1 VOC family protein [Nodularia sp. LEGE 04288]
MTDGKETAIAGIYEVCIGVPDPIFAIQYWEQFGYRIGQVGELPADAADQLYGVNSSLRSIRLYHQNVDHGLIRLMVWQKPTNQGLGLASMKVKGNRWATTLTADLLTILNHAEDAKAGRWAIRYTNPHWEVIYNKERKSRPFTDPAVGVREMLLLQPLTRQVLFQRFGYTLPDYGQINHNAAFKTSQCTHMGMIVQDDSKRILKFYEEVLGLLRVRDDVETSYESSPAGREMFDLKPGEKFIVTAFDDPRSSQTDLMAARSGRLYIIRFPEAINLESRFESSQPGCLGISLYTYRARDIQEYCDRIKASSVLKYTNIIENEFREKSFSFVAPDGYFWNLLAG